MDKKNDETAEPQQPVDRRTDDVLLGRGGARFLEWPGNQRFAVEIERNSKRYYEAKTRSERSDIVLEIASNVNTWGRFIEQSDPGGLWYMATLSKVRKKIGQAVRYKIEFMQHEGRSRKPTDREMGSDMSAQSYLEGHAIQHAQPCSSTSKRPPQSTVQLKAAPASPSVITHLGDKRSVHYASFAREALRGGTYAKAHDEEGTMANEDCDNTTSFVDILVSAMKMEGEGKREEYQQQNIRIREEEAFGATTGYERGRQGHPQPLEKSVLISDAVGSTSCLASVRGDNQSRLHLDQALNVGVLQQEPMKIRRGRCRPVLGQAMDDLFWWPNPLTGRKILEHDTTARKTGPSPVVWVPPESQAQQLESFINNTKPSDTISQDLLHGRERKSPPEKQHLHEQQLIHLKLQLHQQEQLEQQQQEQRRQHEEQQEQQQKRQKRQEHQRQEQQWRQQQSEQQQQQLLRKQQQQEEQEERGLYDDIFDDESSSDSGIFMLFKR